MNEKIYTRRIAILTLAANAFIFGGIGTFFYSLLDACGRIDCWADIYTDDPASTRKTKMPIEFYLAFAGHSRAANSQTKVYSARNSIYPALRDSLTVNKFLASSKTCVYDAIIFNEVGMMFNAIVSGLKHPAVYLYAHQDELYYSSAKNVLLPGWLTKVYQDILKRIEFTGILTQCPENVPLITDWLGVDVSSLPITLPDEKMYYQDFSKREGICFLGSGENRKNPKAAIAILNRVKDCPKVYFYIGRGIKRVKSFLKDANFPWEIREKVSRLELRNELKKRKIGLYTSHVESYGLAVAEQMHYFPVVLRKDVAYAAHFPSAIKFDSLEDGAYLIDAVYNDEKLWKKATRANRQYIKDELDIDKVVEHYLRITNVKSTSTVTGEKVAKMTCDEPMRYDQILKVLNWQDTVGSMSYSVRWPVSRFHTSHATYLASRDWSLSQFKEWYKTRALHITS